MLPSPGAIVCDISDAVRIWSGRKGDRVIEWLDEIKPLIPLQAYRGYRGWYIAKALFLVAPFRSLSLYATAILRRTYSPKLTLQILAQIVLPDNVYRNICDFYLWRQSKI